MAYRRKQQVSRVSTYREEFGSPFNSPPPDESSSSSASSASASSLAAKAIRASSAYRDSSISSAYSPGSNPLRSPAPPSPLAEDVSTHDYTSVKSPNEPKQKFWGVLARKAKALLDDDFGQPHEAPGRAGTHMPDRVPMDQYNPKESRRKTDGPALQKGFGAIASSLNYIGGTIGNAIEEGLSVVENRTADIIQETRKLQIRKKGNSPVPQNQSSYVSGVRQQPVMQLQPQTDSETQLKASRDVAMAMAAKAKLLLRELKTVKADLAFAKERCAQLEEENRMLRETRENGDNAEDDDLIRLQLETLLAEKARLAQENSVLARENRFLREIVEYHQLTMQDVVYLDENSEEVSEVYPMKGGGHLRSRGTSPTSVSFSIPSSMASQDLNLQAASQDVSTPSPALSSEAKAASRPISRQNSFIDKSAEEYLERH